MLQSVISIIFFIWVVRNTLFWLYLWQLKEYRLDRLRVHLLETVQGRSLLFSPAYWIKWATIFLFGVTIFNDNFTQLYEIFISFLLVTQALFVFREIFSHTLRRPVWTKKAILIFIVSCALFGILIFSPLINFYVWLLIVDKSIPFIVSLCVFFLAFPTEIYRDIKIRQAIKKMEEYKNILVIGVSGSYGKTSTKEYIAQILSRKYSVVKTPLSNNTVIGVVQTILLKITDSTEIFVVELGAYKRGEIAELAAIVKPTISVTTAISDQHISLYGSMENVYESENELIQSLPKKDGLALFNGNSEHMQALVSKAKVPKVIYQYYSTKPSKQFAICAYGMQVTTQGVSFIAVLNGKEFLCKTSLFGAHVIENILPAVYLADKLGMTTVEIQKGVSRLTPPPQTMEKISLVQNIVGIDDTFNASPESVFAALDYLLLYKKKRILVMGPLSELGFRAKKRHLEIGEKASKACDYLFVLNKNFSKEIKKGIVQGKGKCQLKITDPMNAAAEIASIIKLGDVVLFEGKESKMVMKKLL